MYADNENADPIASYPGLTDVQRQRAREQAKSTLLRRLGGEPRFSEFSREEHSRYGPGVERLALAGVALVLLAAFTISAIHIYSVGHKSYLAFGGDPQIARIVGAALVILAESSVIALSVIPTAWSVSKPVARSMGIGVVLASLIAFVGNVDATIVYGAHPWAWLKTWAGSLSTDPLSFLFSTAPPALVVIVGLGFKGRLLRASEERTKATNEYRRAIREWRELVDNIEQHDKWGISFFNALWDEWSRAYGSRYQGLDDEVRLAIVTREMDADAMIEDALKSRGNFRKFQKLQKSSGKFQGAPGATDSNFTVSQKDVIDYLKSNPDASSLPGKELAAMLGASEATVSRARRAFSSNGHGKN